MPTVVNGLSPVVTRRARTHACRRRAQLAVYLDGLWLMPRDSELSCMSVRPPMSDDRHTLKSQTIAVLYALISLSYFQMQFLSSLMSRSALEGLVY